ncbi:MAG: hypothetical protein EZS28_038982 [Streblomastix strix]|uniref:Uncharacterized protein n=1 Tax=Streblomastix strix TaxID=222440 RepID=A0A5J4U6B8_9EUKA|nr:MAG: hypothetical protein EZS28_038982 [Streblomastix strix]
MPQVIVGLFENTRLVYFSPDQQIQDLSWKHYFLHRDRERYDSQHERRFLKMFGDLTCKQVPLQLFEQEVWPDLFYCVVL